MLEFRVLGPIEVWHGDDLIAVGGPKPRALLAALVLAKGAVVALDRLVDSLWGERPPERAVPLVHTYVSALRRALAPVCGTQVIQTRSPGYALDISQVGIDLLEMQRLAEQGRSALRRGEYARAGRDLRTALELWRGPAFGGLDRPEAIGLEEVRLGLLEDAIEAELGLGADSALAGTLTALTCDHPLRERFRAQLMQVLHQLGRQAEALRSFDEYRALLVEEYGLEPGPELTALHDRVLRCEQPPVVADPGPSTLPPMAAYRALDERSRAAFHRLGLLSAASVPVWVLAALLDSDEATARQVVDTLCAAGLITPAGVDDLGQRRFRQTEPAQLFAAEQARAAEPFADQRAAVQRVAGALVVLAGEAHRALPTGVLSLPYPVIPPWRLPAEEAEQLLTDPHAWLCSEHDLVSAVVQAAADHDADELCCALAVAVIGSSYLRCTAFSGGKRTHLAALDCARRTGNRHAEAVLLSGLAQLSYEQDRFHPALELYRQAAAAAAQVADDHGYAAIIASLGTVHRELGQYRDAEVLQLHALQVFDRVGDRRGSGYALYGLGYLDLEQGRYALALRRFSQAAEHYRACGARRGQRITLRAIALVHRALGRLETAEELCTQALGLCRTIQDRIGEAYVEQSLGKVWLRMGRFAEARNVLADAMATCRDLDDLYGQALVHRTLGELYAAQGLDDRAADHLRQALELWTSLEVPVWRARTLRDLARVSDEQAAGPLLREAMRIVTETGSREAQEWRDCMPLLPISA
ncbi:hypothetical protein D5S17_33330 [Pseudonocardiaceae bacterium YIM PH 21723]|nr:hypothetical protein D5S17_33330 [Pseudonocardiaceae bacterium YIM PH 21723]